MDAGPAHRLSALLVSPDAPLRGFLVRLLERRGHRALVAREVDEALRLLSHLPASPDVLLLDGRYVASGRDVAPALEPVLRLAPRLPVLFVGGTGRAAQAPRLQLRPAGWVPAPVDGSQLLTVLEGLAPRLS
jgi:CheY-like chemotaxis protein